MGFIIRGMKKEDKSDILEMMSVFYSSPAVLTNGSNEIFNADFDACVSNSPYLEGYIFESEGKIIGYSMLAKSFSTEFGKPCIWIEDIYLQEDYRGMGIGSEFFEYLDNKYKDVIFRLEAEEENERAIHVYKKAGFEVLPYLEMKK
ncbi:MAG: GNAT family N-acetyltransferase [Clostridia bacterium]|nr:GNAT family N-acetyltransferase [Clostridia bacterium]